MSNTSIGMAIILGLLLSIVSMAQEKKDTIDWVKFFDPDGSILSDVKKENGKVHSFYFFYGYDIRTKKVVYSIDHTGKLIVYDSLAAIQNLIISSWQTNIYLKKKNKQ